MSSGSESSVTESIGDWLVEHLRPWAVPLPRSEADRQKSLLDGLVSHRLAGCRADAWPPRLTA